MKGHGIVINYEQVQGSICSIIKSNYTNVHTIISNTQSHYLLNKHEWNVVFLFKLVANLCYAQELGGTKISGLWTE